MYTSYCQKPPNAFFVFLNSLSNNSVVVYFDKRTHACTYVCMVENNKKHSKIMKKVPFSSCIQEAHVRLMKNNSLLLVHKVLTTQDQNRVTTKVYENLFYFHFFHDF